MSRLDKSFYLQPTLDVARGLLGQVLVFNGKRAIITETEAYIGPVDKACHAYGYKRTKRTETMFKEGGHIYVYLIYGMYCCLNIVTEKEGEPCAVLIRGIEGISGPGKLCKTLGITKEYNGMDLFGPDVYIEEGESIQPEDIETGKRVNIDYAEEAKDLPWRFSINRN